jgi:hypothetical protein
MAETTSFSVKVGFSASRLNQKIPIREKIYPKPHFRAFRPCLMAETTSFSVKVGAHFSKCPTRKTHYTAEQFF